MGLEHEPRVFDLAADAGGDGQAPGGRRGQRTAAIHDGEPVQAEIVDQVEVPVVHAREDQLGGRALPAQLQRHPGHHAEKGAVHAGTVVEIQDEAVPALPQHDVEEILQVAAVRERRATLNAHHHGIGVGIDKEGRFGGVRHRKGCDGLWAMGHRFSSHQ